MVLSYMHHALIKSAFDEIKSSQTKKILLTLFTKILHQMVLSYMHHALIKYLQLIKN